MDSPRRCWAVPSSSPRSPPRRPVWLRRLPPLRRHTSIIGARAIQIGNSGSRLLHPIAFLMEPTLLKVE
eukprot:4059046-Pleurochrysis_carterae.AAC.1